MVNKEKKPLKKSGRKPVATRALTPVEKTIRQQNIKRIIRKELENIGCRSINAHIPPSYLMALHKFEGIFKPASNTDTIQDTIKLSSWICKAIEGFIRVNSEIHPNSEMAKIFNSDLWPASNRIDFEGAEIYARIAIHNYIKEQNERISNEHHNKINSISE